MEKWNTDTPVSISSFRAVALPPCCAMSSVLRKPYCGEEVPGVKIDVQSIVADIACSVEE